VKFDSSIKNSQRVLISNQIIDNLVETLLKQTRRKEKKLPDFILMEEDDKYKYFAAESG